MIVPSDESGVVALSTKVTFEAISWRDNSDDFPILFQFGYFFTKDGVCVGQPNILQPFSTFTSLQTTSLPMGTLQPVLWVKDNNDATRMVYLGCDDYRIGGVWATHVECPSIETLVVHNIAKRTTESYTARMTRYLDDEYDLGNFDAMTASNFLTVASWIVTNDDVSSGMCSHSSYQCHASDMRTWRERIIGMANALLASGQPIPASQLFRILSPLVYQPMKTLSTKIVQSLENALDEFTRIVRDPIYAYDSGMDAATASFAIETLAAAALFRNSTQNTSNALALKLQHRVNLISDTLLEGRITNEPTVIANAYYKSTTEDNRILIEVGCYQGSASAMQNNSVKITHAVVYFPRNTSYISQAQLSQSESAATAASTRQSYDVHRTCINYFASWYANPYSYDNSRDIRSGIVLTRFSDVNAHDLSWSYLKSGSELRIGLRLTDRSGSPKCFYRRSDEDDYYQVAHTCGSHHVHTGVGLYSLALALLLPCTAWFRLAQTCTDLYKLVQPCADLY